MNDNPMTGEWTTEGAFVTICNAHTAALAAEREKREAWEQAYKQAFDALNTGLKRIKAGNIQDGVCACKDWREIMNDNPTTCEWTTEKLREYLGGYSSYDLQLRAISKLLAAERLRIWREAPDQPDIQEAVIAKLDLVHRHAIEEALAAERGNVSMESSRELIMERDELKEQLAAAVEAFRELRRSFPMNDKQVNIIDAALARIGVR